ncbi:rho GTPase-activating 44-like isoform X2 [Paramuricea clavata]|uniref:Rho GTPase-activating 44-like isoform X2 n=2 Tax=Paramuricea clavata TaxID=317549 RepID=A0A6S7H3U7_PARCT|nr:rho GTPase-activating 44-like isoform X2 [Paramuricea clavata]
MRKQFYRVKQLADQRVGRAEKTAILNEDLQDVEKKVEKIRQVCQTTSKKLNACMQSTGPDVDKRLKKLPHSALAQSMEEVAVVIGEESILGNMARICGNSQTEIAKDIAEYEMEVERNIIAPFQTVVENDIPSINQNKKKLAKIGLDMDTLRSRYHAALKAKESGNPKDYAAAEAKTEQLKTHYEDEMMKFEAAKDLFITEMLTLVSKEREYAEHIRKFAIAQLEFHQRAAEHLEEIMPLLDKEMGIVRSHSSTFGCPLEKHLESTKREIALVIEECVRFIFQHGMDTEGLFRIAGQATKVRKLKASFDAGLADLSGEEYDVHAVTGALKQYLRELPEPLMTFELHHEWIEAGSIRERDDRLQKLWTVVSQLPKANKDNLRYLIKFLAKIEQNSEIGKMNAHNLAIVMAPNLIWSIDDESGQMNMKNTGVLTGILEALIEHADWFFSEDVDFSSPKSPTLTTNRTDTSSSNEEKHSFKNNTSFRRQLSSSDESTKRPTLLNEAATLVDVKPVVEDDNEMSHSDEKVDELLASLMSVSDEDPKPPLLPKRSFSPPGVNN